MHSLKQITKWTEEISGSWNGEDGGSAEDRAGQKITRVKVVKCSYE